MSLVARLLAIAVVSRSLALILMHICEINGLLLQRLYITPVLNLCRREVAQMLRHRGNIQKGVN